MIDIREDSFFDFLILNHHYHQLNRQNKYLLWKFFAKGEHDILKGSELVIGVGLMNDEVEKSGFVEIWFGESDIENESISFKEFKKKDGMLKCELIFPKSN